MGTVTFTYGSDLSTDRDWIRIKIGDTVSGSGPRPGSSSNYTDEEIASMVTEEGTRGKAAAALCEVLAMEWTAEAGSTSIADFSENLTARAQLYKEQAIAFRRQYGRTRASAQPAVTRVDGFSDDIDAEEV